MSLNEIIKKIVKDFDEDIISGEKLKNILDQMDEGHQFILTLIRDKNNFELLKQDKIFDGHIDNDKRGWLARHNFPITLEILNKEKVPGGAVSIPSMGGSKADLLVYHALCPELENFVSLIVWLNSQSSKNAWNQILDLINQQDYTKVLQFSEKCSIELPNTIHPSHDRDSRLVEKNLYESLYDWKYAYYLFDDGNSIMSHTSPINFRRVVLDEWTKEESFIEIRTTIGRLDNIKNNSIEVNVPSINRSSKKWEWFLPKKFEKSKLKKNKLYFFQLFKKIGEKNIETHVREIDDACPLDIIGMFLSQSLYLLYLNSSRLKLFNPNQFEKLSNNYYNQISKFCIHDSDEISSLDNFNWKFLQQGYTASFTKWIDGELYFLPPVLRRYIAKYDLDQKEIIIKQFDTSFNLQKHNCFEKIPYDKKGNRLFSTRLDLAKMNKIYDFIHFLLKSQRFILEIGQNQSVLKIRDEKIIWLNNLINSK